MADSGNPDPLAIPTPCHLKWQDLPGDHRTRSCATCSKTLHNLSALTRREAQQLLKQADGPLCGTFQRNSAGFIQFQPEPKFAKLFLGLTALAAPLTADNCPVKITVRDVAGGVIESAKVTLPPQSQPLASTTPGIYNASLPPGKHAVKIEFPHFVSKTIQLLVGTCKAQEPLVTDVQLDFGPIGEVIELKETKKAEPQPVARPRSSFFRRLFRRS